MILALEPITSGSILFDGVDLATLKGRDLFALRRRVQPVFQNPYASLDPRYTVEQSIAEPLRVHRVGNTASRRRRVADLLDQVSMPASMAGRLPHELSGGQRQRVAIARALLGDPALLILDEATSALDTESERRFQQNLERISRDCTTFIIAHRLSTVQRADLILVLDRGLLVEQGDHVALMEKRGLYFHLAQQQLAS